MNFRCVRSFSSSVDRHLEYHGITSLLSIRLNNSPSRSFPVISLFKTNFQWRSDGVVVTISVDFRSKGRSWSRPGLCGCVVSVLDFAPRCLSAHT